MDPVTLVLALWFAVTFVLLLVKYIVEEWIALRHGRPSPRLARRAAREKLAAKYGRPTIAQAVSARLVHRIENPPQRRWAVQLRALLTEIVEDALSEAQVRHQRAHAARQRGEYRGWRVRTGGSPPRRGWTPPSAPPPRPAPHDDDDVLVTRPCDGCTEGHVVPPDRLCDACEAAPPPEQPEPTPEPPGPEPAPPNREEPPMAQAATHTVSGDVHDPTTSLRFADECRGLNDAVVAEIETAAANLHRQGVGSGLLDELRVLADAGRSYSRSTSQSMRKYAEHVVSQDDIAASDDVKGTVRRTYLDKRGTPGAGRGGNTTKASISGADCDNPAAGARFVDGVATIYGALRVEADQAHGNHQRDGVSGEPLQFLAEQRDHATVIAEQAKKSAARFREHIRRQQDSVGKDPSLHGTQRGGYFDQAKV